MIAGFARIIASIFQLFWRIISNPFLLGGITIFLFFVFISSGVAFFSIFGWLGFVFIAAIIVSFWLTGLRPILAMIMVTFATIWLLTSVYEPFSPWLHERLPALAEFFQTSQRYANLKVKEGTLSMNNSIRDSEVTIGTLGHIRKSGIGYDDLGVEIPGLVVRKGDLVKSMGEIKSQEETNGEGRIKIMITNKHGDFVGGRILWIPIRNVNWEKQVVKNDDQALVTKPLITTKPETQNAPQSTNQPTIQMSTPPKVEWEISDPNRKVVRRTVVPISDWKHPNGY